MKKFFVDINAGNNFENIQIKEIEYDHFIDITENTIIGYDGEIYPKGLNRTQAKNIRYSYFFKYTLYDTFEDANNYLINQLQLHLNEYESEFKNLKIKIDNIKKTLNHKFIY